MRIRRAAPAAVKTYDARFRIRRAARAAVKTYDARFRIRRAARAAVKTYDARLGIRRPARIRRAARAAVVDVRSCSVRAYGQMGSARAVAAHGAFPLASRALARFTRGARAPRPPFSTENANFRPFRPPFSFSTQSASKTRKTSVNSAWANFGPESKKFITIV